MTIYLLIYIIYIEGGVRKKWIANKYKCIGYNIFQGARKCFIDLKILDIMINRCDIHIGKSVK